MIQAELFVHFLLQEKKNIFLNQIKKIRWIKNKMINSLWVFFVFIKILKSYSIFRDF